MTKFKYSDSCLIKILQDKYEELGRTPKRREIKEVGQCTFAARFGSWNKALIKAGIPLSTFTKLTKDECMTLLYLWKDKHNRIPRKQEIDNDKTMPNADTIERVFNKNWYGILDELGWEKHLSEPMNRNLNKETLLEQFRNEYYKINPSGWREFNKKTYNLYC